MSFQTLFIVLLDVLNSADCLIVLETGMSVTIIFILIYVIKYLLEAVM